MFMKEQGAQVKNTNGMTHGAYRNLTALDGRTKEARFMAEVEAELVRDLGGDPSIMQVIIIRRVSMKELRCHLAECAMLRAIFCNDETRRERLETDYLTWTNSLRADLQLLGLKRRSRPIVDLQDYTKENYGD